MSRNIFLATIVILMVLASCNKDQAKLIVTDFTKNDSVVLKPYRLWPYAMLNIRVRGYCNDTVIIVRNRYDSIPYNNQKGYKFYGTIDTLIQHDYYGEGPRTYIFDPYRATEGKLQINIDL